MRLSTQIQTQIRLNKTHYHMDSDSDEGDMPPTLQIAYEGEIFEALVEGYGSCLVRSKSTIHYRLLNVTLSATSPGPEGSRLTPECHSITYAQPSYSHPSPETIDFEVIDGTSFNFSAAERVAAVAARSPNSWKFMDFKLFPMTEKEVDRVESRIFLATMLGEPYLTNAIDHRSVRWGGLVWD